MTEEDKGFIADDGETRGVDQATAGKVQKAFGRDLMVKDDEAVAEMGGVCFDGVCAIGPADPAHNALVLRNLGALSGLRPEGVEDEAESGTGDTE